MAGQVGPGVRAPRSEYSSTMEPQRQPLLKHSVPQEAPRWGVQAGARPHSFQSSPTPPGRVGTTGKQQQVLEPTGTHLGGLT